MQKPPLKILLAGPRGFCAGVDRAITIVEKALERYGPPVYVRHEIVHNKFVVQRLKDKGTIFIDDLEQVPQGMPVIFSAHGVAKSITSKAKAHNMIYLDATCPLVSRVHRSVERNFKRGYTTILIGHHGHPEVIGTVGQLQKGAIILVETVQDVQTLEIPENVALAWSTQTTLSVDETADIIQALKEKFPQIVGPEKGDICFATTNRQAAVLKIAKMSDGILVLGAPNSSNSKRLVDVGKMHGCRKSLLIQNAKEIDWQWFENVKIVGITAGASAPEILVNEVIEACKKKFSVRVEEILHTVENISFPLPRELKS